MGTDLYHPGNDMYDRRDNEMRKTVAEAVDAIDRRTERMHDFLFGKPGQEYNSWIVRTDRRLDEAEGRMWKAVVGTLVALAGVAWQSLTKR